MAEAAENKAPATETTPAKTAASSKPKTARKPAARKTTAAKKAPTKQATAKTASSKPAAKSQTVKKTAARKTTSTKKAASKATAARKPAASSSKSAPRVTKAPTATAETVADEPKAKASASHETHGEQNEQKSSQTGFDSDKLIAELKEKDWGNIALRGIFMLLFGFLANIGLMATFVLAVIQFIVMVGTGQPSDVLTSIITRLATYIGQCLNFLSFKTEDMPFPLGLDLPSED